MLASMTGRNIVLTGFMGTGKTTVGRLLAERLGYGFVDTDAVIEARHGPIADIFGDHGEARFRELERAVAAELAATTGNVVSTGGRLMLDEANQETLGATGLVICLVASAEEIHRRGVVDGSQERPLLSGPDPRARIEELLEERSLGYSTFVQIDTEERTPDEIVATIVAIHRSD